MKTDGFLKLLRKVIREEVSNAIKAELRPILNEIKINSHIEPTRRAKSISRPAPVATKKQFTKNAMLNDLLNETTAMTPDQGMVDYSTMDYSSELEQSYGEQQLVARPMAPLVTNDINGIPVNMQNENVAKTVGLMTKDYSALMKAIDKKKNK
tara:strand:+ start:320 stop:778 length:459 start_codon:yes stop_codon:yes gene_type:complete